jgi:hypothetical protein
LLIVLLADAGFLPGLWVSHVEVSSPANGIRKAPSVNKGPKPGYYILNTNETIKILEDISGSYKKGESFEELAKKHSDDKDTKGFGGYLSHL